MLRCDGTLSNVNYRLPDNDDPGAVSIIQSAQQKLLSRSWKANATCAQKGDMTGKLAGTVYLQQGIAGLVARAAGYRRSMKQ